MQRKHDVVIDIEPYSEDDDEDEDKDNIINCSRVICTASALTLLAIASIQIYCIDASIKQ
jgi:hypothetical protein